MDENLVILSYGDSLLKKSDIYLLEKGHWLNDTLISFMFEYYQTEQYTGRDEIAFLDPDVIQLIKLIPRDEAGLVLSSLNLVSKELIFIPLNDNESAAAGGTHWSLLVWVKSGNHFELYDSMETSVVTHTATVVSRALAPHITEENFTISNILNTPVQKNQSDCGLYVIKLAELICNHKIKSSNFLEAVDFPKDSSDNIEKYGRDEVKSLILNLSSK